MGSNCSLVIGAQWDYQICFVMSSSFIRPLVCVPTVAYLFKFSCKLAPKSVNPMVILDASTSKIFINYYLKSFQYFFSV